MDGPTWNFLFFFVRHIPVTPFFSCSYSILMSGGFGEGSLRHQSFPALERRFLFPILAFCMSEDCFIFFLLMLIDVHAILRFPFCSVLFFQHRSAHPIELAFSRIHSDSATMTCLFSCHSHICSITRIGYHCDSRESNNAHWTTPFATGTGHVALHMATTCATSEAVCCHAWVIWCIHLIGIHCYMDVMRQDVQ